MRLRCNPDGWRRAGAVAGLLVATLPLAASPIDITRQTAASLHTGDALFFTIATYGFGAKAAMLGLSPYPSVVSFSFVSGFPAPDGLYEAVLETPGGGVIAAFPEMLEFVPGEYQGAGYSGQVGVLEGSLTLPAGISRQLFSRSSAQLVLQNLGPPASLGLSSYTIAHDLTVSLWGGGLSAGAPVVEATVDAVPPPTVPEPGSGWLLAGVAALSWVAAQVVGLSRRGSARHRARL